MGGGEEGDRNRVGRAEEEGVGPARWFPPKKDITGNLDENTFAEIRCSLVFVQQ